MPLTPKRVGSVAYSLLMFVGVSVLAGVLVAGLFVPAAGVAGLGARTGADELENLPAELSTPPQSERSKVLLADGKVLANFYDENRVYVPLKDIAPVMRKAQIAIEDHRFYEHGAIDVWSTFRAFVRNSAGGQTAGGSSITQQYVKMVQIEAAVAKGDEKGIEEAQASTYSRKIQELRYAIALERKFTKDQILERYLNIAYYGDGAYGVEAAAHHYYDTTAKKLTLTQATMLAGLVQNPDQVNPVSNPRAAGDRRDIVINRMAELNIVSKSDATKAKKVKWSDDKVTPVPNGCQGTKYPFLCDYVKRSLLNNSALGKTADERLKIINRGGLTIETEIDPKTQDTAEKAIAKYVDPEDPVISTMTMVQPGTGLILAMAQSRPNMGRGDGETYYNYAVDPSMGDYNGFQAGSTFKAFTAAAALAKGIPIKKTYNARKTIQYKGKQFESCDGPFKAGEYKVSNSTGASGRMNMQRGINFSVNNYFIQLEQEAGLCNVTETAKSLGVKLGASSISWEDYSRFPSFTLGSAEVSPLSMNEAYATFAARGIHCEPHIIKSVKTKVGKSIKVPDGNCKRVLDEGVADAMNQLLSGVVKDGTGTRARIDGGFPQAGKTGTTNDNRAVWFAGYTPEIAGVAMIAVDPTMTPFKKVKGKSYRKGFKNYILPKSGQFLEGSGSGDAGRWIYKPAMEEALKDKPKTDFEKPPNDLVNGKTIDVPSTAGMAPAEIKKTLEKAGFNVVRDEQYDATVPEGYFMYITPRDRAQEFSTIRMVYSAGKDPAIERARERAADEAQKKAADEAQKKAADEAQKKAADEAQKKAAEDARKKAAEDKKKPKPPDDGGNGGGD